MTVGGWARGGCAPHYSLKDSGELSPSCPSLAKAEDKCRGSENTLEPFHPNCIGRTVYSGLGLNGKRFIPTVVLGSWVEVSGLWTAVWVDLHRQATSGAKPAPVGAYWVCIYLFTMPYKSLVGFGVKD